MKERALDGAQQEHSRNPGTRIRTEIDKLGGEIAWTLTATARELRETPAIEHALEQDAG